MLTLIALSDPAQLSDLPPLFNNIINWALIFAGIVALFIIIISGIRFILSGGEEKAADTARKTLTYAIAGLIVILLSFFIIQTIAAITNSSIAPTITIPTS